MLSATNGRTEEAFTWPLLLLSVLACHGTRAPAGNLEQPAGLQAGLATVYKAPESYFRRTVREAILDSARWYAVWDSLGGREQPSKPLPHVDFRRNMLLTAAGPPFGSEDSVIIRSASPSGGGMRVAVTSYLHCYPPNVRTVPVHVVLVQRASGTVRFVNDSVRGPNCVPLQPQQAR